MSTVFATVSTPGPIGPTGPPGYSPQFIVAAGAPAAGTGNNGDMYINSTTGDVYGPKTAGAWGAIKANIKGPTGAAGYSPQYIVAAGAPSSVTGNNGDMYINSSTGDVYGPKAAGAWGGIACNIKGPTGATGPQGPPGVAYTPKGAWAAGTTYTQGDEATDAGQLYISLQSGNVGHVPASSPTWWQPVGSGGSQTPWLSNIDGNSKILFGAGNIGIGVALASIPISTNIAGRAYFTIKGASDIGVLEIGTGLADADASGLGQIVWSDPLNSQTDKRLAAISVTRSGATANNRGAYMVFLTRADNTTVWAERMRIDNTGRVGIGTGAPACSVDCAGFLRALDGAGAPTTGAGLELSYSAANSWGRILAFDRSAGVAKDIRIGVNNGLQLALPAGGQVAIGNSGAVLPDAGTSDPRLLVGSASNTAQISLFASQTISGGLVGSLNFANYVNAGTEKRVAAINAGVESASNSGYLVFYTWNAGAVQERMRIAASGNVAIGTLGQTTYHLHLQGAGTAENAVFTPSLNVPNTICVQDTGGAAFNGGALLFGGGTTPGCAAIRFLYTNSAAFGQGDLAFYTRAVAGTEAMPEVMRLTALGRVGIQKTAPGYPLDVTGDINCSGSFRVGGVAIGTGGITTQASVGGSRTLGTTYVNGAKPLFVTVTGNLGAGVALVAYSDSGALTTVVASNTAPTGGGSVCVSFWVLPGNSFKVTAPSGGIATWIEWS